MSDYTTKATSIFEVNGTQAKEELTRLKKHAEEVREALMQAWKTGDTTAQKGLQKELNKTEKQMRKMQSEIVNVEQVLKRLDKATPKELRQTLRRLEKDLKNIERGSSAWDEQTRKIKAVRTELAKIKAETKEQSNLWERFAKKMFDWGAALQTVMATVTGITMTARQAVQAYAAMDAEMASVRKFTGMTADEVERMNEEFKKIDTRTSREDLNKLAQEAGRLGMQSQEDVLGFVRAADQINVALDDLGDGATLTLSKLTDIFGDKERLGVEQSLLSVGSVINELSQNCTASAPYLAEFASRMGGVGAQAGMSIQQIMAFGAVLDSNNQKVEASSTALSQVITRLYQDPAKYARVAGLDIQKFSELVRTDANEALLTLLQTLNQAGGLERLAPMFKDMGETGARAISALSTLAKHVDDVRRQQLVANQAFREATSVTKEFNVQNNTVQAGLDKAKKAFNEMAVQLGEKLAPAMKYAITSGSALMNGLSQTVDFLIKYKAALVVVTVGIIANTVAVKASSLAFKAQYYWLVLTEGAQKLLGTATLALKVAFFAVTGQINKAKAAYTAFHLLTKTTPWGMIIGMVTALVAAFAMLAKKVNEATEAQKKISKLQEELAESNKRHMEQLDLEKRKIQDLLDVARDEYAAKEERLKAIAALNKIVPGYCAQLDAETGKYRENKQALDDYLRSLEKKIRLEANKEEYERLIKEDESINRQLYEDEQNTRRTARRIVGRGKSRQAQEEIANRMGVPLDVKGDVSDVSGLTTNRRKELQGRQKWVRQRIKNLYKYAGRANLVTQPEDVETPVDYGTGAGTMGTGSLGGGSTSAKTDPLAKEKAVREQAIAVAKIAWLKGEVDYEQHMSNLEAIEIAYYEAVLKHQDLSGQELLDNQVKYLEEKKKQQQRANAKTIADENEAYEDLRRQVQEDYLMNRISKEAYDMQMENVEFAHLRALTHLTKEGTEERRRAEETYRQRLVADQQKRQKDYEAKEKEHQAKLKKTWDSYFVTDEESKHLQYQTAAALLDEVYKSELAKCADNNEKKLELDKRYAKAKKKLYDEIFNNEKNDQKTWEQWIGSALDKIFGEGTWAKYGETVKQAFASMTSMMQSFNQLAQAEAEIKIARIEKQYDREISMAEGNNRKVKALERKKEKETARIKAEAQRKDFAQQVMNAISSTALAAINAYASASKIAWWLGPVAAGLALAAGAVQIAAIKKQQEASEAKGFAEGGFTPAGPKDKPVGVVHAGEWVASQRLLADPVARPMIEALDYAQRNNTLGSLRPADVSRSVTAPAVIAGAASDGQTERLMVAVAAALGNYDGTMARLTDRLNEPFVTVNTVTGDMGIKEAQDEYQRLMNNTLPKSKRK